MDRRGAERGDEPDARAVAARAGRAGAPRRAAAPPPPNVNPNVPNVGDWTRAAAAYARTPGHHPGTYPPYPPPRLEPAGAYARREYAARYMQPPAPYPRHAYPPDAYDAYPPEAYDAYDAYDAYPPPHPPPPPPHTHSHASRGPGPSRGGGGSPSPRWSSADEWTLAAAMSGRMAAARGIPMSAGPHDQMGRRMHPPASPGGAGYDGASPAYGRVSLSGGSPSVGLGANTTWRGSGSGSGAGASSSRGKLHTVLVRGLHAAATELEVSGAFASCGAVLDCRLCADSSSEGYFAFVAFGAPRAAEAALRMSGTEIGGKPIRVVRSRTSVIPVNPQLLPQTPEEVERCARTVYAANIDIGATEEQIRGFFETAAGAVSRILVHGNPRNTAKVAFVEFETLDAARAALRCAGRSLRNRPVRVSQSKTPLLEREPEDAAGARRGGVPEAEDERRAREEGAPRVGPPPPGERNAAAGGTADASSAPEPSPETTAAAAPLPLGEPPGKPPGDPPARADADAAWTESDLFKTHAAAAGIRRGRDPRPPSETSADAKEPAAPDATEAIARLSLVDETEAARTDDVWSHASKGSRGSRGSRGSLEGSRGSFESTRTSKSDESSRRQSIDSSVAA